MSPLTRAVKEHVRAWDLSQLLSSPESTERRCMTIEHLSREHVALPSIRFDKNATQIIRTQEWIAGGGSIHRGGDERAWMRLAEALEAKDELNLVHGDLCVRNLIWSEIRGCCLAVDWEPDLIQIRGNQRVFKVTKGYIHPNDMGTSEPFSLQSDRFAFARCLERTRGVDLLTQNDEMLAPPYIESVRRGFQ